MSARWSTCLRSPRSTSRDCDATEATNAHTDRYPVTRFEALETCRSSAPTHCARYGAWRVIWRGTTRSGGCCRVTCGLLTIRSVEPILRSTAEKPQRVLMMRLSHRNYLAVWLTGLVLLTACGGDTSTIVSGEPIGPDPKSTAELGSSGGTIEPITANDLVARSGAVVEATVVDVHRSRPNTADGTLPSIDIAQGPEQLHRLYALTDVSIRVENVVAAVAPWSKGWEADDVIIITLTGGTLTRILSPAETRALGVLVVDEAGPEREGSQVEVYPDEPVEFESGTGPFEQLTEGDSVLLFLAQLSYPIFGSDDRLSLITPTHPSGIFSRSDGGWAPGFPLDSPVDPITLAQQVSER